MTNEWIWIQVKKIVTISQFLYLDDIKLYAKNEKGINELNYHIKIYSKKCWDVIWTGQKQTHCDHKRGKMVRTEKSLTLTLVTDGQKKQTYS